MPEDKVIDKNPDTDVNTNTGAKGIGSLTLEQLQETIDSQAQMIEELKSQGSNSMAEIRQLVEEKYGATSADMQNLMSLIGGLATPSQTVNDNDIDFTDPSAIESLVDRKLTQKEQAKLNQIESENKAYMNDYAGMVKDMLDDEMSPTGDPLEPKAREGIMKLLKTEITGVYDRKNGTRDAVKNFNLAKARYFGLNKKNPFRGGDVTGAGIGGNSNSGGNGQKKTYALGPEARKLLADIGENEDWAQQQLAKREG